METSEKKFCSICGADITDENYTEVSNGEIVCDDCLVEHFTQCEECNDYVPNDEIVVTKDGSQVCEYCIQNCYILCDDCGEYVRESESTYISDYDVTVCDDCLSDNYSRCESCGDYIANEDTYSSNYGETYCETCYYDIYTTCDDCGCELCRDDAHYTDDGVYCDDCIDEHVGHGDDYNIYDYHCFNVNNYVPRYSADEDKSKTRNLYGLELEVAGDCGYADDVMYKLGGDAIAMYDSSVDGFELVFMPITRKYLYNELLPKLKDALRFMINNDFKGHNEGGIHIHFTKLKDSMQVANMTQIMYGDEKDRKIWQKITQRRAENMHWCSMTSSVPSAKEIIENNLYAPAGSGNHGTALNYCTRTNTHELRIFNSNLRIERVLKNFECVFALEDYVSSASEPICNTRGFINFVNNHKEDYPYLVAFMHEKRIFEIANRFYGDTYGSLDTEIVIHEVNETMSDFEDDGVVTNDEIADMVASVEVA